VNNKTVLRWRHERGLKDNHRILLNA
jgi:hypothetical protein